MKANDASLHIVCYGVVVEASALLQFLYAWGTGTYIDGNGNQATSTINDACFGAGPTVGKYETNRSTFVLHCQSLHLFIHSSRAGAGAGYLLQIAWGCAESSGNVGESLARMDRQEGGIGLPSLMTDLDAAVGLHLGIGFSSIFGLFNRLWFKFGLGAGGGLALSFCLSFAPAS